MLMPLLLSDFRTPRLTIDDCFFGLRPTADLGDGVVQQAP